MKGALRPLWKLLAGCVGQVEEPWPRFLVGCPKHVENFQQVVNLSLIDTHEGRRPKQHFGENTPVQSNKAKSHILFISIPWGR